MDTHIFGSSSVDAIFRDGYISQKGLANLAHYKYSGSDLSFLYNLVLTHYFDWLVLRMPLWIAYAFPSSLLSGVHALLRRDRSNYDPLRACLHAKHHVLCVSCALMPAGPTC
jgi:hypothetical protein